MFGATDPELVLNLNLMPGAVVDHHGRHEVHLALAGEKGRQTDAAVDDVDSHVVKIAHRLVVAKQQQPLLNRDSHRLLFVLC